MAEISSRNLKVERKILDRSDAINFFKNQGEHYKAQIIEAIPGDEDVSLYSQGNFTDLCRGPHVPTTSRLKVFKLMKLAGPTGEATRTTRCCSGFMVRLGQEKKTRTLSPPP